MITSSIVLYNCLSKYFWYCCQFYSEAMWWQGFVRLLCAVLTTILYPSSFSLLEKKWKLLLDPFLCIIKYYSLDIFPVSHFKNKPYYESLTTAVWFIYVFQVPCATWHVVHRHSINICWINELTFLKGQNYRRGSFLKVYNLKSLNHVEVCVCVCARNSLKSI